MSTTEQQQPNANTIIGAGAEANIPEQHRKALEGQDKPFEQFTQREQLQILHTQIDGLRTGFAFMSQSLIEQAGALQCAMGILKQIKPEWTIKAVPVTGGKAWIVVDEDDKPVEGIFQEKASETRKIEEPQGPGDEAPE